MKRERLHLPGAMSVETGRDWNGRFFIAYGKGASVFLRCEKELRRFLKLPLKTASREALDSWLASLEAGDHERGAAMEELRQASASLGPEDPNHQTRTII
jgi:hypothetical protein